MKQNTSPADGRNSVRTEVNNHACLRRVSARFNPADKPQRQSHRFSWSRYAETRLQQFEEAEAR
jgi:hypothetical protein